MLAGCGHLGAMRNLEVSQRYSKIQGRGVEEAGGRARGENSGLGSADLEDAKSLTG